MIASAVLLVSGVRADEGTQDSEAARCDSQVCRLGLNVFGLSFHSDRSAGYNEINPGVGLRYVFWRPQPRWEVFGDSSIYYDSDRNWAKYIALGAYYRAGSWWKVGGAIAYGQSRSYNEGHPFFAPLPGIALVYRDITINTVLLPTEETKSKVAGIALFLTFPLGGRN